LQLNLNLDYCIIYQIYYNIILYNCKYKNIFFCKIYTIFKFKSWKRKNLFCVDSHCWYF